jgi:hypothetical protein
MSHQVFLSYRHKDYEIADQLETVLEANSIKCWVDKSNIQLSEVWDERIIRAIAESKLLLLLITSASLESPKQQKREISVADKYQVPVAPIFMLRTNEPTAFDYMVENIQRFDASGNGPVLDRLESAVLGIRQLLNTLKLQELKSRSAEPIKTEKVPPTTTLTVRARKRASIALLYKRDVEQDERLIELLYRGLSARGHDVFIDKNLPVGVEWRRTIREKVENADAVIPLLSLFSIGSEMLEEEIQIAIRRQQVHPNKPRILPVRVNYDGALPTTMSNCLQRLNYFLWRGPEDDEALLRSLHEQIEAPHPEPRTVAEQREVPVGAIPLTSPFYIVRAGDSVFEQGINGRDSIVLVKGARQMGKTSLIARGLQLGRTKGAKVAITDLQTLNDSDFHDLKSFYTGLAYMLTDQLDLKDSLADEWQATRADNVNFERFLRVNILKKIDAPLVWALDEVDRLFPCSFGTDVFGLFRSWHNKRALEPDGAWTQLTLVMGFATEAELFIRDVNMSPFNVGTRVALTDFTEAEVSDLNGRYGNPLKNDKEIHRLMERVGGQPFLVRRSLYALAVEGTPIEQLLKEAANDQGLFGDHLKRFYISLHRDQELEDAVRQFILQGQMLSTDQFQRLRSAGLIVGETRQDARVRCGIYRDYLQRHLS